MAVPCQYVYVAIEELIMAEDGTDTLIIGVFATDDEAQTELDKRGPDWEKNPNGGGHIQREVREFEIGKPIPLSHK